jgi:hypothetical protein
MVIHFLFYISRLAFKIISEVQATGDFSGYKKRVSKKNLYLGFITGIIIAISLTQCFFTLYYYDKTYYDE